MSVYSDLKGEINVHLTIEKLAELVVAENYGVHQFLFHLEKVLLTKYKEKSLLYKAIKELNSKIDEHTVY